MSCFIPACMSSGNRCFIRIRTHASDLFCAWVTRYIRFVRFPTLSATWMSRARYSHCDAWILKPIQPSVAIISLLLIRNETYVYRDTAFGTGSLSVPSPGAERPMAKLNIYYSMAVGARLELATARLTAESTANCAIPQS